MYLGFIFIETTADIGSIITLSDRTAAKYYSSHHHELCLVTNNGQVLTCYTCKKKSTLSEVAHISMHNVVAIAKAHYSLLNCDHIN